MRKATSRKKERKAERGRPNAQPANVCVMHRLSDSLSKDELVKAVFPLWKFALIEEGRTLAKQAAGSYEILQDFPNAEAADRYCDNLRRNNIECVLALVAPKGFVPLGQILPPDLADPLLDLITRDPEVLLASAQTIAKRMETKPGKNYLLPDLTPEQYKLVASLSTKKPH